LSRLSPGPGAAALPDNSWIRSRGMHRDAGGEEPVPPYQDAGLKAHSQAPPSTMKSTLSPKLRATWWAVVGET
jgi:hypothetical protein